MSAPAQAPSGPSMKVANLPGGRKLRFAPDTPDEIMDAAVRDSMAQEQRQQMKVQLAESQAAGIAQLLQEVRVLVDVVQRNHAEVLQMMAALRADQRAAVAAMISAATADKVPIRDAEGVIERVVSAWNGGQHA